MKRLVTALMVFTLLLAIVTGCSSDNDTKLPSGETMDHSQPQFAILTKILEQDYQNLTYTGGEMRIPYLLQDQSDADAKWGLEILLDGILQDFAIEDHGQLSEKKKLHVFPMKQGASKNITLIFTPNTGKKNQKLNLNICTMLNPAYMPTDPAQYEFRPNHSINGGGGACLTMQQAALQSTKTSTGQMQRSDLTQEQKEPYINKNAMDESGNPVVLNELEQRLVLQLYQSDPDEKSITVPSGRQAELTVHCFGKPGKYRISVYVNHELQPVFGEESYLDVTVERDKSYQRSISIDLDKLSEKNHIYAVAAPIRGGDSPGVWSLEKTQTKLLIQADG